MITFIVKANYSLLACLMENIASTRNINLLTSYSIIIYLISRLKYFFSFVVMVVKHEINESVE